MVDTQLLKRADEGSASWFLGTLVTERVTPEETDGAYSLTEHLLPPTYETPYHLHRSEEEVFYVLEGELTLYTENGTFTANPGETVVLPREQPHGYRVTSDEPVRKLVLLSPAGFEGFFREAGETARTRELPEAGEPDFEKLEALAPKYDLEILGPLPKSVS